jgi:Uncharacterized membrane protein
VNDVLEVLSAYPHAETLLRILLAGVLGGAVGYEREQANRPAGFRTNILVCVGAALVMLTGEHIHNHYGGNTDPARLGAQVISGIGFLGAGTILRSGFHVRGLTTAASLWAVSCVGLACGAGFYVGAFAAAVTVCATLISLKHVEKRFADRNSHKMLTIRARDVNITLPEIQAVFAKFGVEFRYINYIRGDANGDLSARIAVKIQAHCAPQFCDELRKVEGVHRVSLE